MSSYLGKHAEFYDIFYSDKDYAQEADFLSNLILSYSDRQISRILDIACGTGSHDFNLEKLGYDMTGIDYSKDMIGEAKRKAGRFSSTASFEVFDMRNLKDLNQSFDVIICLFDSIGYVLTNENVNAVLSGVFERLNPSGIFILEFWHAPAMIKGYDPVRIRRWSTNKSEITRISETEIDYASQICNVKYSIFEKNEEGLYSFIQETQKNRFFLLQEMLGFLTFNGFTPMKSYAGFSLDEQISDKTWHVLTIAKKSAKY